MRDVYEVLREKERAIQRIEREIKVLRMAAPLLTDDTDVRPVAETTPEGLQEANGPLPTERPPDTNDADESSTEATDDVKLGAAKRISARLKRMATPLLNVSRATS